MAQEDWIAKWARETAERVMSEVHGEARAAHERGDSPVQLLFSQERKANLQKLCKSLEMSRRDLSDFIFACKMGLKPWRHRIHYRNFVPEHLQPTDAELKAVGNDLRQGAEVPPALRTIMRQFDERRMLIGHVFYNGNLSRWHLLYFDQRDSSTPGNHWEAGAHVHLANWLTRPGVDANTAWKEFCSGNPKVRGSLHIRCLVESE